MKWPISEEKTKSSLGADVAIGIIRCFLRDCCIENAFLFTNAKQFQESHKLFQGWAGLFNINLSD